MPVEASLGDGARFTLSPLLGAEAWRRRAPRTTPASRCGCRSWARATCGSSARVRCTDASCSRWTMRPARRRWSWRAMASGRAGSPRIPRWSAGRSGSTACPRPSSASHARSFTGFSDQPPAFWAPFASYHALYSGSPLTRTSQVDGQRVRTHSARGDARAGRSGARRGRRGRRDAGAGRRCDSPACGSIPRDRASAVRTGPCSSLVVTLVLDARRSRRAARVRQRGEPAAGERARAPARDRRPPGARRRARAHHPPARDRKPRARPRRGSHRAAADDLARSRRSRPSSASRSRWT